MQVFCDRVNLVLKTSLVLALLLHVAQSFFNRVQRFVHLLDLQTVAGLSEFNDELLLSDVRKLHVHVLQ